MVDTQSATAEIRRGKKRKKESTGWKYIWPALLHRAAINKWSKQFDMRPHHHRRRTFQSHLPSGANVPSHAGTLAPPSKYDWTCASFGPPESTTKQQIHRFSRFCTAHGKKSLHFTMGNLSPKISPSHGDLDVHLIYHSFGHSEITIQMAWRSIQPFSHRWPQSVPTLYYGRPFPQKLPLPMEGSGPHLTWFLEPIRVHNPNGISIGSAIFAQMTAESLLQWNAPFPSQNCPFP